MKILTIVGARPQFIKAGSVSREIQKRDGIKEIIVHTGQHYDINMSDVFFEELQIPRPDYSLGIRALSHGAMTGRMIEKVEEILLKEKPDWVLVYGDTNSTLAGALAASKLHIKIAHVEAGLRSFNMNMPEEVNRIVTDRISSLLFCPTKKAMDNLYAEGFDNWNTGAKAVLSGDVMYDGALFYQKLAQKPSGVDISENFVLSTVHRQENTDDPERLKNIIAALNAIAEDIQVILPLHPRTKKFLKNLNYDRSNITITNPVGYLNMVWLIDNCRKVITDSGGLQKEAYFFAKPCITMRDETEWAELLEEGANVLVGADRLKILTAYQSHKSLAKDKINIDLYGGGQASKIIVKELLSVR